MAFDFNLSLHVFSRGSERGQQVTLSSKGAGSMNEWLDDELAEIEEEERNEAKQNDRLALTRQQMAVLWDELRMVLRDAVSKMNADDSKFRKLTGGLSFQDGNEKIIIRKTAGFPPIEFEATRAPLSVSWLYSVGKTVNDKSGTPKGHATLKVDLDDKGHPFFQRDGKEVSTEQVAREILRPLVRPAQLDQ
jgi:hypothetical protein